MNLQKRRTGGPNLKFWEDAQIIGLFDPIRHWLTANCKDSIQNERLTNRSLSQLCLQILLVQDDNFGSLTREPRGGFSLQYKLPLCLFQDFGPNGSICHLIKAALNLKKDRQWSRLPLQSTSNEGRQLELWTVMLNEVIERKLWQYPKIFFHSSVSQESVTSLSVFALRFGGELVESPDDATHIIYPASTTSSVAKDEIRPVIQSDGAFLLHWRYSAISQQLWTTELPEDSNIQVEKAPTPGGPWEVDSRWLINTDLYREWVPEEDYLVNDQLYAKENGLPLSCARKHFTVHQLLNPGSPNNTSRKRPCPSSPTTQPSAPSEKKKKESSKKSQNKVKQPPQLKSLTVEIEKDPFLCFPLVTPVNKVEIVDMDNPAVVPMLQTYLKQWKTQNSKSDLRLLNKFETLKEETKRSPVLFIPEKANWYDHQSIHQIERQAFPQYFPKKSKKVNCNKPRQLYMAYRNFMIDSYRSNPSKVLSFSECAESLPGNATDLLSIYNFLNHWGLINASDRVFNNSFECDSMSTLATALHQLETSQDDPTVLLLKKNDWHYPSHIVRLEDESSDKESNKSGMMSEKLLPPRVKRFANPTTNQSRSNQSATAHDWTDEETLFLLEAIELYEDDWNAIAGHVGSRTEDECIQQMLRLPIEDPYLCGNPIVMNGSMGEIGLPFARSGNPVMAMISFLASTVSSKIVSSAAKSALRVYCNNLEDIVRIQENKATDSKEEIVTKIEKTESDSSQPATETKPTDFSNIDNSNAPPSPSQTNPVGESKDCETSLDENHKPDKENLIIGPDNDKEESTKEISSTSDQSAQNMSTENVQKESSVPNKRMYASLEEDHDLTKRAVEAALKSAMNKARDLASIEERKLRVLVMQLLNVQMKKIDIKMKELQQLDSYLDKEHNQILQQREQVIRDRKALHSDLIKSPPQTLAEVLPPAVPNSTEPSSDVEVTHQIVS